MKLLVAFASSAVVLCSGLVLTQPAKAGCGWLDITCRDSGIRETLRNHDPSRGIGSGQEDSGSCTMEFVRIPPYSFDITNSTNSSVSYAINGQEFSLSPGYYRQHSYPGGGGTDGCNVVRNPLPTINFDTSYDQGYQGKNYRVGDHRNYRFVASGSSLEFQSIEANTSKPTFNQNPPSNEIDIVF